MAQRVHLNVNYKLLPFMTQPQPIKVAVGGRGSGKSLGVGDMLTFKMETEGSDIYCLREFQDSVTDSVHKVFKSSVEDRLQLPGWQIQQNAVIAPNGATTRYKGANRNPDAMQSAQGYKYSWFEEAHRASQASLDKLLPTILRNPGAQCWFTANPQSSNDPFSQRFLVPYLDQLENTGVYEDKLHYIVVVNWRDNPWWNEEQELLRAWDYEHLSRAKYDWIWEGHFMDSVEDAIIEPEWFDAAVGLHEKLGIQARGARIASHDPADMGGDTKGYAFRHGSVVKCVDELDSLDVNAGCDWAIDCAIRDQADNFCWDGDGLGAALKRQVLQGLQGKQCEVEMFKGSESPKNPDKMYQGKDPDQKNANRTNKETFKNKRAQAYWLLRDRFYNAYLASQGHYIDPDEIICLNPHMPKLKKLRSEICRVPRIPNGNGLIQLMSKPNMKKLGIPSPGMADALAMGMLATVKVGKKKKPAPSFASGW